MFDYRLRVFFTVANRLSFSKAAEELHITQPAITRHIKQIENHFGQKLFERKGNSIALTKAGSLLFSHSKRILQGYKELEFDMNALVDRTEGVLRIAASTTVAQYVLPLLLAKFHKQYPKVKVSLISANTEDVENAVLGSDAELGFIEGRSKNRELAYQPFLKDEIVPVVGAGHPLFNANAISLQELKKQPLVLREEGSGTLEIVLQELAKAGIAFHDLNVEMRLGSSVSIKSYLGDDRSMAFLSVNTVLSELKSGELGIVDVTGLSLERDFHYIFKQGHHSALSSLFLDFLRYHYKLML